MAQIAEDDVVLCNCADCRTPLLAIKPDQRAEDLPAKYKALPIPSGRIKGRPYCRGCLSVSSAGVSGLAGGMSGLGQDCSPSQSNAIRAMEDS